MYSQQPPGRRGRNNQPPWPRDPHEQQPPGDPYQPRHWQQPAGPYQQPSWEPPQTTHQQPPPGGPYQQPQRREVIEFSDAIPPGYVPPDRHRERVKVAIVGSVEAVLLVLGATAGLSPAFVFVVIVSTGIATWIGAYKGRTADAMILGFVLGIIGVIIIAFLPKTYDRRVFEEARRRAVARDADLYGRAAGQ
jgi:hypothetical protein